MKKISSSLAFALLFGLFACSSDDAKEIEGIWTLSSYEERIAKTRYLGGGTTVEIMQNSDLVDSHRQWRFNLDPQIVEFAGFKEVTDERLEMSNGDTLNYSFAVIEKTLFGSERPWELKDNNKMIIGVLPRQYECTYEVTESELSLNINLSTPGETHTINYRFTR